MDEHEARALELADKITETEAGNIRSIFGVVNLTYKIVEETMRRSKDKKFKYSAGFKKELTLRILRTITELLKEKELIDSAIFDYIITNLNDEKLEMFLEIIEDTMEIWDSDIVRGCLCRGKKKDTIKKIKLNKKKKIEG
jgi:hypothetical protein